MKQTGSGESKLEVVISYILVIGVITSLILTLTGLIYYTSQKHFAINLDDRSMYIHGQNFFSFIGDLATGKTDRSNTIFFITLGIIILLLTPYIRVVASTLYFGVRKDLKYVLITLFVLVVLTVSLLLH